MPTSEKDLTILSFDEAIQENLDDLKSKYEKYFPSESFTSAISDRPEFEVVLTDSLVSDFMERFSRSPAEHSSTPFFLSFHFSKAAMRHRKKGEMDKAWLLLSKARYFAGIADASLFGTEKFLYEAIHSHAIKGTSSRSKNSAAAQEKAAELILEIAKRRRTDSKGDWPGWESRHEAADAIAEEMRIFLTKAGIGLKHAGISRRVYEWMREDEGIRNAFNETCAEGATYTPQKRRNLDGF